MQNNRAETKNKSVAVTYCNELELLEKVTSNLSASNQSTAIKLVGVTLELIDLILTSIGDEMHSSSVAIYEYFQRIGGHEAVESVQHHPNKKIYSSAQRLIKHHFSIDERPRGN